MSATDDDLTEPEKTHLKSHMRGIEWNRQNWGFPKLERYR